MGPDGCVLAALSLERKDSDNKRSAGRRVCTPQLVRNADAHDRSHAMFNAAQDATDALACLFVFFVVFAHTSSPE